MFKKISILVASSVLIAFLWSVGLEKGYAHVLAFTANAVAGIGGNQTSISLNDTEQELVFTVSTLVGGRRGTYPQKAQTLLLPVVMVFAWQLMVFLGLPWRQAAGSAAFNLLFFLSFHVVFLLLLTSYYNSEVAKFFFHLMMETFYVVALMIIIKDSIKYPQIWRKKTT